MRARPFAFDSDGLALGGELVLVDGAETLAVLVHGMPSGAPPDPDDRGYAGMARDLAARGISACWLDLRGAREAPGDFSLAGWALDLDAALDALATDADTRKLRRVVVGSSMGGCAAIVAAARRGDVAAVATLAAPADFSYSEDAQDPERLLRRLRNAGVVRDPAFPPDLRAWHAELTALAAEAHVALLAPRPVLVVHGEDDTVVPPSHATRLYEAACAPKELVLLPAGAHQLRRDPRILDVLTDWLRLVR